MLRSRSRPYTVGRPNEDNSTHLGEVVALCQSVLARYKRSGTAYSAAELTALTELRNALPVPPATAPVATMPPFCVESSAGFLKDLEAPCGAPEGGAPSDVAVPVMKKFIAFVEECGDCTKDAKEAMSSVNAFLTSVLHRPDVRTFLLYSDDGLLMDPVHGAAVALSSATPVGRCAKTRAPFESAGALYIPVWTTEDFTGCIEVPSGTVSLYTTATCGKDLVRLIAVVMRNFVEMHGTRFERKKTAAMMRMATRLAQDALDTNALTKSVVNKVKMLTESERCGIFFSTEEGGLVGHMDDGTKVALAPGVNVAEHVAKTGEVVNIVDARADPRYNPEMDRVFGSRIRSLLCLPVVYDGTIMAVAMLLNKSDVETKNGQRLQRVFGQRDEELFTAFSMFAAASLRTCHTQETLLDEQRKSEAVLDMVTVLSQKDICDADSILGDVLHGAKTLLHADRSTLFLLDKERNELVSRMADDVAGKDIRCKPGQGIAGTVAATGVGMNITDAYADPRFNPDVDRALGYRTVALLCEPILRDGVVLGVVQLVNKLDDAGAAHPFTAEDQRTFKVFSLFAGISINNSHLLSFAVRAGQEAMELGQQRQKPPARGASKKTRLASVTAEERAGTLVVDVSKFGDLTSTAFDLFALNESCESPLDAAAAVAFRLLLGTGLPQKFGCKEETLLNFILRCRRRYRRVPYHNFFHVVDVCQTLHTFLYAGKVSDLLTELECFVLLITALVHDLDHMGVNNSFYLRTDSPLGILSSASGNSSVLEVHHCRLAIEILSDSTSNIFEGLRDEEAASAYQMLIDCVLATDMAKHADEMQHFLSVAENGLHKEDEHHRRLVMQTLMKAADVSNVTKPFDISRRWAMAVTEEFYRQGDMERERGMEVLPMFDRSKNTELARGQIGFIDFVAGKFFRSIVEAQLQGMQWCVDTLCTNRGIWQKLLDVPRPASGSLSLRAH